MTIPAPAASAKRRFQSAGERKAIANSKAPPSKASDSHTGDRASHTAARLAFDANRTKPSAVPPASVAE